MQMLLQTTLTALALGASLTALPALAAPTNTPAGTATVNSTSAAAPSQRNPVLADNGDVRMSKLIGTDVYNQQDQKRGSIDDVLMGRNGRPDVIMQMNGNLYKVPWTKLDFRNASNNSDNQVIIPGTTQHALSTGPQFHYHAKNNS
jgi:hypothetical protein